MRLGLTGRPRQIQQQNEDNLAHLDCDVVDTAFGRWCAQAEERTRGAYIATCRLRA